MFVEYESISEDTKVWVYPSSRKFYETEIEEIEQKIKFFLENWKSGHYFEINDTPIVKWKKGDYVMRKNDVPHMAANLGRENRYTMQVTGIYG